MKQALIFIFSFLIMVSCDKKLTPANCEKQSNEGFNHLDAYLSGGQTDSKLLLKSLEAFNKAVKCDSSNYVAHQNKLTVLLLLKKHNEAISEVNILLKVKGLSNDPQLLITKSKIYNSLNQLDSASFYFNVAITALEGELNNHPDSIKFLCPYISLLSELRGKASGDSLIKSMLFRYPDNTKIMDCAGLLENEGEEIGDTVSLIEEIR